MRYCSILEPSHGASNQGVSHGAGDPHSLALEFAEAYDDVEALHELAEQLNDQTLHNRYENTYSTLYHEAANNYMYRIGDYQSLLDQVLWICPSPYLNPSPAPSPSLWSRTIILTISTAITITVTISMLFSLLLECRVCDIS